MRHRDASAVEAKSPSKEQALLEREAEGKDGGVSSRRDPSSSRVATGTSKPARAGYTKSDSSKGHYKRGDFQQPEFNSGTSKSPIVNVAKEENDEPPEDPEDVNY